MNELGIVGTPDAMTSDGLLAENKTIYAKARQLGFNLETAINVQIAKMERERTPRKGDEGKRLRREHKKFKHKQWLKARQ